MWERALELLNEMEVMGVKPSEVTFSVTITACGNGGQWQKALELLSIMRERKIPVNLYVYNAAITALSKAAKRKSKSNDGGESQMYTEVMNLLSQMEEDGIKPDGFSFSSAISCCGSEGRWEEALKLIKVMQLGGPRSQPNKVAYTAAITSCGRSGQADHAITLFRQMKEQGLQADRVAYNALFSALRVAKKPDAAFDLWDEMLGTKKSSTDKIATAGSYQSTTPDIITVTE
jgi:pentatricopeptide repeat protein